jgi:predicted tellurium resistance membrane protein TerC
VIELVTDPAIWASFLTLALLEIVLGIDNVIFISIVADRLPPERRRSARLIGLSGALVMRILLLFSITWLVTLTQPIFSVFGHGVSWRDIILLAGGLFLLWKASTEIFSEVEGGHAGAGGTVVSAGFVSVIFQIMLLDLVFSLDSVITAVGIADDVRVMIAAVIVAIVVMMVAAEPIGRFVSNHPSTKMLALAFLVMVGMVLVADGFGQHIEKGFVYAAMVFALAVEALNLWRQKRHARIGRKPQ